jgi:phage protein D
VPITATFLVTIDGTPLPEDMAGLLSSALVDDSLHLPDAFALRFRDPGRVVIDKTKVKIGSAVTVSVLGADSQAADTLVAGEVTALEAEFDGTGTFTVVRGYDHAHRLHRGRRTESYTQMTASDVATKVAKRAGLQIGAVDATRTVYDHLTQGGVTDAQFLTALARETGQVTTVRDGKFEFRSPKTAADGPQPGGAPSSNPLVLQLGTDLLRFRAVVTSAGQVGKVEVRGWDVAQKRALVATEAARTSSASLQGVSPAELAKTFGDPLHVSADTPFRLQAEVDTAALALSEEIASAFAEFDGVARGNSKLRANTAIAIDNIGAPFDGQYTITTSRHRYDPTTGYTTAFSVTGRHERSMLGLASSGGNGNRYFGVVVGQVSDVQDPQSQGRVMLTYPWLSDTYVSDWARTVQLGAGKDRGAMIVPEVGDEVLVAFEQGDMRRPYVLGGLHNGVDIPAPGPVDLIDSGSGAVNRRSVVSRLGHRIDLVDKAGSKDGVTVTTGDGKLRLALDSANTTITVTSDGTVRIMGAKGIVIDAGTSDLDLKGGKIAINGSSGVKIDGASGGVDVNTGGPLKLRGAMTSLEGQKTDVKGDSLCSISAQLVKIN